MLQLSILSKRFRWILYILVPFCVWSCTKDKLPYDLNIRLKYYYQATIKDKTSLKTALKWYLSHLGAQLAPNQLDNAITWVNSDDLLDLDFGEIGFPEYATPVLAHIIKTIKNSDAYKQLNSIDLGRFVMLTLNSSHHYYAITGVYNSLDDFRAAYNFEDTAIITFYPGESSIAVADRIVYQTHNGENHFLDMAFIATEGKGSVQQGNFEATEFEVFDFMPNGQPRFAIYNKQGQLKTAVPALLGTAGKPSKCMWCHESNIQPNFTGISPHTNYFNNNIYQKKNLLDSIRSQIISELDYQQLQEHSLMELLYISFMEPNVERLAEEWDYSMTETQTLLQPYTTHTHHEYPQLGPLYNRAEIDHLGPHPILQVPESAREESSFEPNY
ncbi:MAG: hypothetical protein GY810_24280 [Aureispira sp.]|nr:hypothetical protein [Aureispira sp.]